jgi:hypothetical protein
MCIHSTIFPRAVTIVCGSDLETKVFLNPHLPKFRSLTVNCMCKCIFTDVRNKSRSFRQPIFTQFSNAEHHLQLSYTGLYPNWTIHVEVHSRP